MVAGLRSKGMTKYNFIRKDNSKVTRVYDFLFSSHFSFIHLSYGSTMQLWLIKMHTHSKVKRNENSLAAAFCSISMNFKKKIETKYTVCGQTAAHIIFSQMKSYLFFQLTTYYILTQNIHLKSMERKTKIVKVSLSISFASQRECLLVCVHEIV